MKRRASDGWRRLLWLGPVACYLVLSVPLLPAFRMGVDPDGISYLSIASRYLAGDYRGAINAYWGPLYSWLMIPFLAAVGDPLLGARLLALVLGVLATASVWLLATRVGLSGSARMVAVTCLVPLLVLATFYGLAPDLLLLTVLILYVATVAGSQPIHSFQTAALVGACGALAYWAKAYGFYFFIAHVSAVIAVDLFSTHGSARRRVLVYGSASLVVFAALCSLWIATLGWKYGTPTIGSSGAYNRALLTSPTRGHPMFYKGFLAPPDAKAVSVWEDPSYFDVAQMYRDAQGMPAESRVVALTANVRNAAAFLTEFAAPAILLMALALVWPAWRRQVVLNRQLVVVLLAAAIYCGGYLPLTVVNRYLSIVPVLLTIAAAMMLLRRDEQGEGGRMHPAIAVLLIVGMAFGPVMALVDLHAQAGRETSLAAANTLAPRMPRGCSLASNQNWKDGLFIAYRLGCQYFGQRGDIRPERASFELARLGVGYYLTFSETPAETAALRDLREISNGAVDGLRVYQIPPAP